MFSGATDEHAGEDGGDDTGDDEHACDDDTDDTGCVRTLSELTENTTTNKGENVPSPNSRKQMKTRHVLP